jgi:DNA-directed RNA polymerase specialized sigma24 family protein
VQEVYLRATEISRACGSCNHRAWLYKIATNRLQPVAANSRRTWKGRRAGDVAAALEAQRPFGIHGQIDRRLRVLVNQLPAKQSP